MTEPTLALCMAGRYRRFAEAGYRTPKFLLPWRASTILAEIVRELAPTRLLCVANRRDEHHTDAILAAARAGGVDEPVLRFIGDTEGQAATAQEAARLAADQGWDGPFVLHNVDTVLVGRDLSHIGVLLGEADGFIDVFRSGSAAYSYVDVEADGGRQRVTRIAEKVVISPWATSGLYGFTSPQAYEDAAARTTARSRGEFYVSDVYGTVLREGGRILANAADDPGRQTIILGTPAEYRALGGRGPL